MRILFCILFGAALAISQTDEQKPQPSTTKAPLCRNARTQFEMNACMAAGYSAADKDLNQFYSELAKKLDPATITRLQKAQRAWINYRDANCDAEAALYDGGSIVPATRSACLERNTRERLAELHRVYDTGTR